MKNRIKAPVAAVAAVFVLSGCNLLDVDNPNSLVEESIRLQAAANGVANGSLQLAGEAISGAWELPAVISDELFWIGSRDAWGQLDQGFVSNAENEFTDGRFPALGRAVWMSQNAVEILEGHFAEGGDAFQTDYGRALMFRGMILMVTAELQEDMTFSYKMVDGPPVSSGNAAIGSEGQHPVGSMVAVMDLAIQSFTDAITQFNAQGESALATNARAMRARAYQSRVIMQNRGTVGGALASPNAAADAAAVLADVSGDWSFDLTYTAASASCTMCGNVNDRKENQIDLSLITVNDSNDPTGINLMDPLTGADDLALIGRLNQFKGGDFTDAGGATQYAPLTVVSERLLQLIIAEDALANSDGPGFEAAINAIRDLDNSDAAYDYAAAGDELAILQHTRRVNTLLMGLRLQDMYRWGLAPGTESDPGARWAPQGEAVTAPGTMLPIAIIEVRANCYLNGRGCEG